MVFNWKQVLVIFGVVLLQGCIVMTIPPKESSSIDIPFEDVCAKNMYGVGQEGILDTAILINSEVELNQILTMINSVNPSGCDDLLKELDFSENTLVFIVDFQKGSGGHLVQIDSISQIAETLAISWSSVSPTGASSTVMTHPFLFSIIANTKADAIFSKN